MTAIADTESTTTGRLPGTRAYRSWVPTPDTRGPMAVDVIAAAAIGLLVVNAFDPAYGSLLWLTVGGLGVGGGLLVAYLTVQLKANPIIAVISTVVGFFALGGYAVPDTAIVTVLPGPGTPAALFDGITHGWARLLTTVPPVGTVDHLAAIVYLGGFVTGGFGLQLARRTRSSWLPVLPALVVEVAAILVGTHHASSTLAQGAGVAVVVLAWTSMRGARTRPRVHLVGSNAWTRRLTGVAFVLLLVGGGVLINTVQPLAGADQRHVLRDSTVPPFDPNNYPSPLTGYPAWRKLALDTKTQKQDVLTVKGLPSGNIPVRLATMDVYDGNVWLVGNADSSGAASSVSDSDLFMRVGSDLNSGTQAAANVVPATEGPLVRANVSISVNDYEDVWVPTLSGLQSVRFAGKDSSSLTSALRFNAVTGSAAAANTIGSGSTVGERASVPEVSYVGPTGSTRDDLVRGHDVDRSAGLGTFTEAQVNGQSLTDAAHRIAGSISDPYTQAKTLEQTLAKGYFGDGSIGKQTESNNNFPPGHSLRQLDQFLNMVDAKGAPLYIGNAERYSAAMAGMARQLGLPARVVVGFRPRISGVPAAQRSGDVTKFTAQDLDAWVEIAFQGVGWVGFFPTPSRKNNKPPSQKKDTVSPKELQIQAPPPVTLPPNPATLQDQNKKKDSKSDKSSNPFHIPAWVWLILKIIFYPLIVIAAVVGAITGYKRWRRNRRRSRGSPVDRVSGAWAEMLDQLRDLGTTVPRKGTRLEVAGGIGTETWEQLPGFAAGIDAAMFGPDDPDDESVTSLWAYVDAERTKLLAALERKRRWFAQLNLRSLKPWR